MASYNRVVLLGNLTRDPELRYIPSGMAVVDVGIAVNDRRKTADGQWVEEPTFVDITLFGRTAEVASEYLSKGSLVLIEGRLKYDAWEAPDGQKRSRLKVIGDRMQMLGPKGGGAGGAGGAGGGSGPGGGAARAAARNDNQYSQPAPPEDDFGPPPESGPVRAGEGGGEDIPF